MEYGQCSGGSGSGRIGIILADPDTCPFQLNGKLNYTLSRKFQNTVQNIEIVDTFDVDEKDKPV
jgi:hypothetical protein